MRNDFDFTMQTTPYDGNCQENLQIRLCTYNPESHMNLYIGTTTQGSACLHPDDARKLRDALIAAYPLNVPSEDFSAKDTLNHPCKPRGNFIVAVIDKKGRPRPADKPAVHKTLDGAFIAAEKLATQHPGCSFSIFQNMGTLVQVPAHVGIIEP